MIAIRQTDSQPNRFKSVPASLLVLPLVFLALLGGYALGVHQESKNSIDNATTAELVQHFPNYDEERTVRFCGVQGVYGLPASYILTNGEALLVYALDATGLGTDDLKIGQLYKFTVRNQAETSYLMRIDPPTENTPANTNPCPDMT